MPHFEAIEQQDWVSALPFYDWFLFFNNKQNCWNNKMDVHRPNPEENCLQRPLPSRNFRPSWKVIFWIFLVENKRRFGFLESMFVALQSLTKQPELKKKLERSRRDHKLVLKARGVVVQGLCFFFRFRMSYFQVQGNKSSIESEPISGCDMRGGSAFFEKVCRWLGKQPPPHFL